MEIKLNGSTDFSNFDKLIFKFSKKARQEVLDQAKKFHEDVVNEVYNDEIINSQPELIEYSGVYFPDINIEREDEISESNDKSCHYKTRVVASGEHLYFIEFGTGQYYDDDHPWKDEANAIRGSYGEGHGNEDYWFFRKNEPVSDFTTPAYSKGRDKNGNTIPNMDSNLYISRGNPANKFVYNAYLKGKIYVDKIKIKRRR